MRKRWIVTFFAAAALFTFLSVASSDRAEACSGSGGCGDALLIPLLFVTVDVALTGADFFMMARDERPHRLYGIAEVAIAGFQLYWALKHIPEDDGETDDVGTFFAIWMGALTMHGLYWTFAPDAKPLIAETTVSIDLAPDTKISFMPTVVSDGKDVGGGLGAVMIW